MKRRQFIAGLGAATCPLTAPAQQFDRMRRIGVLIPYVENDPLATAELSAFVRRLAELGWSDGRNLRIDIRWAAGNIDRVRTYAKELVSLRPDVILADATPQTAALQRETSTIPIVFVVVSDPVGSGFVATLSRPGGNITGFIPWEPTMGGKWVELLTEIAPGIKRIAALYNPDTAPYVTTTYLPSFEAAARSFKVEPIAAPVHSNADIENVITSLGREPRGGLAVMPDGFFGNYRSLIISQAFQNKVPAVFQGSIFPKSGGLLSYGANQEDVYHRAASYVDRILRGGKPADLPVQLPVKFEMVVNLRTAKALGLAVPQSLLLSADEVVE